MKTVIWNRADGTCTFAFKFKNGNFAEYVGKEFKTVQGAEHAASKAKEYYGEVMYETTRFDNDWD